MNIRIDGARRIAVAPGQHGIIARVGGQKTKNPAIDRHILGLGLEPSLL